MNHDNESSAPVDDTAGNDSALLDKLADASMVSYQVELDPGEAETAGAFAEDALSEQDALDSGIDLQLADLDRD